MKIVGFWNLKGGVGKTTACQNLAVALVRRGLKVAALDLDPQSNLTMSFGIDVEALPKSIFDVLVHSYPIEHIIQKTPECDIAVASIDLAVVNDHELEIKSSMMYRHEDYLEAIRLVEQNRINLRALVSKRFPFRQYQDAYRHIDEHREQTMKVLINVQE